MFNVPTRPWRVRLHWTTAAIEVSIAVVAWSLPDLDLPLRRIAVILLAAAVSHGTAATWMQKEDELPAPFAAAALALDALLLTALLELTGGPFNPFVVVYGVQIVLAAFTLGAVYAWPFGLFTAICYGVVVYWHLNELVPPHHRVNDFPTHLFAMWMLLAAGAELAAFFVAEASRALAEREAALDAMRQRAARSERIVSLTTLAAGAAHELSTPLGTIALAARELEHAIGARGAATELAEDARLIRKEVDRCRAILDQMSGRAGGVTEDVAEELHLPMMLEDIRTAFPPEHAARIRVDLADALAPVALPRAAFRQAVFTLIANACDASRDEVRVAVAQRAGRVSVTVRDRGPTVAPGVLRRAGEPFFTTKEPGHGMGLGLFLARVFAERVGGTVTLQSGDGTTACLDLPIRAETA